MSTHYHARSLNFVSDSGYFYFTLHSQLVVREDISPLLGIGEVFGKDAGNGLIAFLPCRLNPPVANEDVVLAVDHSRGDESEFP